LVIRAAAIIDRSAPAVALCRIPQFRKVLAHDEI
jgi:hypothetical protein